MNPTTKIEDCLAQFGFNPEWNAARKRVWLKAGANFCPARGRVLRLAGIGKVTWGRYLANLKLREMVLATDNETEV